MSNKHKNTNNKFFAIWARYYDFEKYISTPLRNKAVNYLQLTTSQKVLDLATGTGAQALAFARQGHQVIGVDISPHMLIYAKKKLKPELDLEFAYADASQLPFVDDQFDVTSISVSLHDMPLDVCTKVLSEMARVTKHGGKMLVVEYNEPKNHWLAKAAYPVINLYDTIHYKKFIDKGLCEVLTNAKLRIDTRIEYFGLIQIATVIPDKSQFNS